MAFTRQGAWTTPIVNEADRPKRSASAMKAVFDANSNDLKGTLNGLMDDLEAETGASSIGTAGGTLQAALDNLAAEDTSLAADIATGVAEAKAYTDQAVFDSGAADMRAAVYDPQGKKADVFQYADTKAEEAVATAVSQAPKAKVYTLTLAAASWAAEGDLFKQAVTISGVTANTKVDLDADLLTAQNIPSAIRIYNDNGSCYAYTVQAPVSDITVQATAIETEAGT